MIPPNMNNIDRGLRLVAGLALLALGHVPNVRTPNALPLWCEPPAVGPVWSITPSHLPSLG